MQFSRSIFFHDTANLLGSLHRPFATEQQFYRGTGSPYKIRMPCHSCYRLIAAVDLILAVFTATLWYIVYLRSEDLIRLQFERNVTQTRLRVRVSSYKAIIRSIGSSHDVNTSVEILNEVYNRIQDSCGPYYRSNGITVESQTGPEPLKKATKMKNEAIEVLKLGTLVILICVGVFMFADALIMCSTRHGKASNKIVICLLFSLQCLSSIIYILAALKLRLDPMFCLPTEDLRPMVFVIILISGVCKPLQLYVMCHYFCDVRTGAYTDEPGSDIELEEVELEPGADPNNAPTSGKGKRVSIWAKDTGEEMDGEGKNQQDNDNLNIDRTGNATDITKA